jgi:hypothetical protein
MKHLDEADLIRLFDQDKKILDQTLLPIVTVSASFKEDLKRIHGLPENNSIPDVVFSRAHLSMSLAVAVEAWQNKIDPHQAWVVDPTNYVAAKDRKSIQLTEIVGKVIARQPLLKTFKDFIDRFGRSKLPILESIAPPLLLLTQDVHRVILSMHIAAGNMLVEKGKNVLQVVTDPHVRDEYVTHADKPNLWYCVFDEQTKTDLLEIAALHQKKIDEHRVIVTGPPVDPRIIAARHHKHAWRNGPLQLCITTGGLGTNKKEIEHILHQLLPELRKHDNKYQLLVYTGTQTDIRNMVKEIAAEEHVEIGSLNDKNAKLRLLYHPQIVDANELLISHAFPWADGFITKPSGDMAYDAVAAGCFLLTLKEWGVWEHHIFERFAQKEIARAAYADQLLTQLSVLMSTRKASHSWIEEAMNNAFSIDPLLLKGTKNILKAYAKVSQEVKAKDKPKVEKIFNKSRLHLQAKKN